MGQSSQKAQTVRLCVRGRLQPDHEGLDEALSIDSLSGQWRCTRKTFPSAIEAERENVHLLHQHQFYTIVTTERLTSVQLWEIDQRIQSFGANVRRHPSGLALRIDDLH